MPTAACTPRATACCWPSCEVLDGLPHVLAQGLFATAGTYPVVMRFSTTPGDLLDDSGLDAARRGAEGRRRRGRARCRAPRAT